MSDFTSFTFRLLEQKYVQQSYDLLQEDKKNALSIENFESVLNSPIFLNFLIFENLDNGEEILVGLYILSRKWTSKFSGKRSFFIGRRFFTEKYQCSELDTEVNNMVLSIACLYYNCEYVNVIINKADYKSYEYYKSRGYIAIRVVDDFYQGNSENKDGVEMLYRFNEQDYLFDTQSNWILDDSLKAMLKKRRPRCYFSGYFEKL